MGAESKIITGVSVTVNPSFDLNHCRSPSTKLIKAMGFGKYVQPDESAVEDFFEGCRGLDTDKEPLAAGVHFRVMVLFSQRSGLKDSLLV